jgi:hypothetical protein
MAKGQVRSNREAKKGEAERRRVCPLAHEDCDSAQEKIVGKIARRRRQVGSNPAGPIGPWRSPRLEHFPLQKKCS